MSVKLHLLIKYLRSTDSLLPNENVPPLKGFWIRFNSSWCSIVMQVPAGHGVPKEVRFPKHYHQTHWVSVIGAQCRKEQGKQLLNEIINVYASLKTSSSDAQDPVAKSFRNLGNLIERCSGKIFKSLRTRLRTDPTFFFDATDVPEGVLFGTALRPVIAAGLRGATTWNVRAKAAVVRLLLSDNKPALLSHIALLSEVCSAYVGNL